MLSGARVAEEEAVSVCLYDFDGDGEDEVACALPCGRLCVLKERGGDQLEEMLSFPLECEGAVVFLLAGRVLEDNVANLVAIDMAGVAHVISVHMHSSKKLWAGKCFSHPLTTNICTAMVMAVRGVPQQVTDV
eukprot:306636-Hanusia_phi.AAC.3